MNCHPERPTCPRQIKTEMNAEIDMDTTGFIVVDQERLWLF